MRALAEDKRKREKYNVVRLSPYDLLEIEEQVECVWSMSSLLGVWYFSDSD